MNDTPRFIAAKEMEQGMVVRMARSAYPLTPMKGSGGVLFTENVCMGDAFLDHAVVSVTEKEVKLARPYAVVSGTETSCPTVLTGVEQYSICRDTRNEWLLVSERSIRN